MKFSLLALIPLILLDANPDINILGIADKITTIGILIYIAYRLDKKLDKMADNARQEEKEIRQEHKEEMAEVRKENREMLESFLGRFDEAHRHANDLIKILTNIFVKKKGDLGQDNL